MLSIPPLAINASLSLLVSTEIFLTQQNVQHKSNLSYRPRPPQDDFQLFSFASSKPKTLKHPNMFCACFVSTGQCNASAPFSSSVQETQIRVQHQQTPSSVNHKLNNGQRRCGAQVVIGRWLPAAAELVVVWIPGALRNVWLRRQPHTSSVPLIFPRFHYQPGMFWELYLRLTKKKKKKCCN